MFFMNDLFFPKSKLILFTGNYGSGKSESAIHYTLGLARYHKNTTIIDMDVVSPYFRCREATELMESHGIHVIIPPGERRYADLPIIVPEVKGCILQSAGYTILDVGGEEVGARVLACFQEAFQSLSEYELLLVVNRNRPFTSDVAGVLNMQSMIEQASQLKVTGYVSNTHLMDETDLDTICYGNELVLEVSAQTGVPIFCTVVHETLVESAKKVISSPILSMYRILLPPHLMHLRRDCWPVPVIRE